MITLTVEDEMAKFEMYQDKSGEYRWRLRATNQQIIASSREGYKSKEVAEAESKQSSGMRQARK
jgi:uncharacterized protein YegP (UPF0339 family)